MSSKHVRTEAEGPDDSSKSRPKLLFLCQTLPFPPDGGVEIRSFNLLRQLARTYDIKALFFYRKVTRGSEEQVNIALRNLADYADVAAFPIPQEHRATRMIWDHLRSVLTRRVYTKYAYESKDYQEALKKLLADNSFDLVHMDSLDLSGYLPLLGNTPVVCTHHNVESELLRRRARTEPSGLRARYLDHQASLMAKEEREWCGRVRLNVAVSEGDAEQLKAVAPDAAFIVVPNGVDTGSFQPADGEKKGLIFVGGYGWYPNREAMEYFAENVLPLIHKRVPDLEVTWVGRAPDPVVQEFKNKGIHLTGYVDDIRPYVTGAACFIVPLQVGGGSRLKILDAWSMGKAVISTSVGCEGLDAQDGSNILIRDNPAEFAAAVLDVLNNEHLRLRLENEARQTTETKYDWDIIGRGMTRHYLETSYPARRDTANT